MKTNLRLLTTLLIFFKKELFFGLNKISLLIVLLASACEKKQVEVIPVVVKKEACNVSSMKSTTKVNGIESENLNREFLYDKTANMLRLLTKSSKSTESIESVFIYDQNNRLIEENSKDISRKFSYTADGKLSEKIENNKSFKYLYHYKYNYINPTTIEKLQYENSVSDANLIYGFLYTVDANQNVTNEVISSYFKGKVTSKSTNKFEYNAKGQLVNEVFQFSTNSFWYYRYVYDSNGNHTHSYLKINNNAEQINTEKSDFMQIPTPKADFKEWTLSVEEPVKFGNFINNYGKIKNYEQGVVTREITVKNEYDMNNILIKTTNTYTTKQGSGETILEKTIKCQ